MIGEGLEIESKTFLILFLAASVIISRWPQGAAKPSALPARLIMRRAAASTKRARRETPF
ncbi:MAG: hypothetical protein ACRED2_05145 [Methylocella sp.]